MQYACIHIYVNACRAHKLFWLNMWECRISCQSSAYFTKSLSQHSLHSLLILTCFGQGNIQHRTQQLMVHSKLKLQNSAQHLKWSWWGHLMEVKNLLNCWVINASLFSPNWSLSACELIRAKSKLRFIVDMHFNL